MPRAPQTQPPLTQRAQSVQMKVPDASHPQGQQPSSLTSRQADIHCCYALPAAQSKPLDRQFAVRVSHMLAPLTDLASQRDAGPI